MGFGLIPLLGGLLGKNNQFIWFYNILPAKLTVKDVSKFGRWGRSFSFLKPCLAGSNFLFEQASSKIVSKGVCLLILTVILWPSGQSTFTCVAIFLIENLMKSKKNYYRIYRTDWLTLLKFGLFWFRKLRLPTELQKKKSKIF